MYREKRIGPKTKPCGTSELSDVREEEKLSILNKLRTLKKVRAKPRKNESRNIEVSIKNIK